MKMHAKSSLELSVLFLSLCILGCDPVGCLEVEITNGTNQEINVQWFSSQQLQSRTEVIGIGATLAVEQDSYCDIGGMPTQLFYEKVYDSIAIFSTDGTLLKLWKPELPQKNIFDTENYWQLQQIDKWDSKILFIVEESDLD